MKLTVPKLKLRIDIKTIANKIVVIASKPVAIYIAVIIFLIGINIVSQNYYFRLDLTQNQVYTLSNSTKNILSNLDKEVTITAYISDSVPEELSYVVNSVSDVFTDYERVSGNKVKFVEKDPKSTEFRSEATAAGLREVQFSELSQDKFELASGFVGATIEASSQTESIPLISSLENLEYEITSRIYKLTSENKPQIGVLTGHGEAELTLEYSDFDSTLATEFSTIEVNLSEKIDSEDTPVLLLLNPSEEYSEEEIASLTSYVKAGGNLLVLADSFKLQGQTTILSKVENNLNSLLEKFGLEIKQNVILDESYLPLRSGLSQIAYPYWVLALGENMNKEIPPLSDIESATFFWPNEVTDKQTENGEEGYSTSDLIKTTEDAWLETGEQISVDIKEFNPSAQQQHSIAKLSTLGEGKVVVIGDSEFLSNNFGQANEQNFTLGLNLIGWLSNANELGEIRTKNIVNRPITTTTEVEKLSLRIIVTAISPLLLLAAGIGFNLYRRRRASLI